MATKDTAESQAQKIVDEQTKQGFSGLAVDPTPNDSYTLAGVTSGKPTPETDEKAATKAASEASGARSRFTEK